MYFLIINVVRDLPTLRRVTWALLLAGCLMGGLSIFQKVTHTENNIYGGLAQVSSDFEGNMSRQDLRSGSIGQNGEVVGQVRAAGPIGETNRYGQRLVVLLPLAVLRFCTESSRRLRVFWSKACRPWAVTEEVAVAKSDAAPASPGARSVVASPAAFGAMLTLPSINTIEVT